MSILLKSSTIPKDMTEQSNTFLDNTSNKNTNINFTDIPLKKEIYNLKEKIKELEYKQKTYLLKISDLTKTKNILLEEELINKRLTEELKIKQDIIERLQSEILKEAKDKKEEQRLIENKFNTQLIYYKRLHDTGMAKENAASSIIKLNETQHNCIVQLENKIDEIKNFYEKKIKDIELGHENRYSKLKKQMMEFLKNSQKNMAKNNEENLELNSKLTILYKNQMLNELENQSHQIEELLKEREKQNKEIYILKEELKVHKKVEEIIRNKNSKYLNMINKINIKINQINDVEDKNNDNKNKDDKKKDNNFCRAQSVKLINNNFADTPRKKVNNTFKNLLTNDEHKDNEGKVKNSKSLQDMKELNNKIKNNQQLKQKNLVFDDIIKNDYNNEIYNNLFKETILIFNQALEKIVINKKITCISKSHLFTDNFNFNILTNDQKYELLIEIMKKILLFLNLDNIKDFNILKIKKKIDIIKINDNNILNADSPNFNMYKTSKLINYIGKNKKYNSLSKKKFPNINNNKKKEFFNKVIFSKINQNKENNQLITSFRGTSPNPLIRYIHLKKDKDKNIEDKKNTTFFKSKIEL